MKQSALCAELLIDPLYCRALGLALRGLLVQETRNASLVSSQLCTKLPAHLPEGLSALTCRIKSMSGLSFDVVLGGPLEGGLNLRHGA